MRYLGDNEATQMSGIGELGELAQGPDGMLYQWVEGIDGLGNPIGFWRKLRRLGKRLVQKAQQVAPLIPGFGPAAAAALKQATPYLQRAGLVGVDGLGALYQAPDGAVYRMEGVGAQDELNGYLADDELQGFADDELHGFADDELQGFAADDELRGFAADDELDGLEADEELSGLYADEDLRGMSDDNELRAAEASEPLTGVDADDDMSGIDEGEELHGLEQGYVRQDGVQGVDAFVPQQPPATRWFTEPGQAPALWKPLW
jgi:hypothetical protein